MKIERILVILLTGVLFLHAEIDANNLDYESKILLADAILEEVEEDYKAAAKDYLKLYDKLKKVPDRASCKQKEAECWFLAGKTNRASEAYQELVRNYALYVPFSEVVPKIRILAERYVNGEGTFLGLSDVVKAISLYNLILLEAPAIHASRADRERLAELYMKDGKPEEAVAVYQEILKQDPALDEIRLKMSKVLIEMSRRGDGDGAIRRTAARNIRLLIQHNPDYGKKEEIKLLLAQSEEVDARRLLDLGKFYLRQAHYNPKAAQKYLEELALNYPDTRAAWEGNELLSNVQAAVQQQEKKPADKK